MSARFIIFLSTIIDISMILVRLFRRDGEPVPYWYKPFALRKIYALLYAFRCENTAVFPRCSNSKTMLHATLLPSVRRARRPRLAAARSRLRSESRLGFHSILRRRYASLHYPSGGGLRRAAQHAMLIFSDYLFIYYLSICFFQFLEEFTYAGECFLDMREGVAI